MTLRPVRLVLLIAALSPAALAQSPADAAYCQRLVELYDHYVGQPDYGTARGTNPGGTDAQVAVAQCRQGNPAGIPVLERALQRNGVTLPSRG
jgi:hypothetical protein